MIRQRRTARTLRGDWSERDAPLRQAEGTGLSYAVTDRTRNAASQPARAVRGRPRLETRVKESQEGNVSLTDIGETWRVRTGGVQVASRLGARA